MLTPKAGPNLTELVIKKRSCDLSVNAGRVLAGDYFSGFHVDVPIDPKSPVRPSAANNGFLTVVQDL